MFKDLWSVLRGELSGRMVDDLIQSNANLLAELNWLREERKAEREIYQRLTSPLLAGVGRVLAKLDPLYGVPEDDPARRAASDKLSKDIIDKLNAEQAVLRKYDTRDL